MEAGLSRALAECDAPGCVNRAGSLLTMFLGPAQVRNADEARSSDTGKFARLFHALIERNINVPPSQFEAMFISLGHTDEDIDLTITAAREALKQAARG